MQKLHEGRLGVCTKGLLTVVRQMLLGAFEIRLTLSILYPIPFSIFLSLSLSLLFTFCHCFFILDRSKKFIGRSSVFVSCQRVSTS